ncbi:MAG: cystathionine gamma-synthase family protein [Saprospiraceae bacterium]|nr:cystathionine gamma-synthase family protein [Saprospiraceae bacterium]MCB9322316.1 cystathionine gamma-synthase family protein [Lewinellaceae bacterium]
MDKRKKFQPESLMMSYGYKPELSEGAIKVPVFQTSTYCFKTAEEGKAFFEVALGKREQRKGEEVGLIYSRLNNPNMEILENRLCLWDKADDCAVFDSGMAAISTVLLEFLRPGDVLLYNKPLYGGTVHFIEHILVSMHVTVVAFHAWDDLEDVKQQLIADGLADKLKMIYVETPANPTNHLVDIGGLREMADALSTKERQVILGVDNTYLGPLWQHPLQVGADLVIYSATKFIAGHSDLIAGAVLGSRDLMRRVKTLRTFLGNMASPYTSWLMLRSLETLKIRMEKQAENAKKVADFLRNHPKVEKVYYIGFLKEEDPKSYQIFKRQCSSAGSMLAFDVVGGEKEAFIFLNNLQLMKLAVSLGSTESLAEHPATMTHSEMEDEVKNKLFITGKLVRISVGIENADDLITDIREALDKVPMLVGTEY